MTSQGGLQLKECEWHRWINNVKTIRCARSEMEKKRGHRYYLLSKRGIVYFRSSQMLLNFKDFLSAFNWSQLCDVIKCGLILFLEGTYREA